VATYDIFPTVLSLAGAPVPKVVLDGLDISQLLLSTTPEKEVAHDCIMFYKRPESQLGAVGAAQLDSLAAVRYDAHGRTHLSLSLSLARSFWPLASPLPSLCVASVPCVVVAATLLDLIGCAVLAVVEPTRPIGTSTASRPHPSPKA
jgi:hypothetical protein